MGWFKEVGIKLFGGFFFRRRINQELEKLGVKGEDLVGTLSGYKTYITAGLGVLSAIAAALVGDEQWSAALNKVWEVLMPLALIFLRKGVTSEATQQ